ncbi:hypothetical protein [Marinagarivorans cellulosilyticus]|uniref:hypothetical protein n=1 Tax=Marinagarivorans cellulosilyticus TaxID=2721545 RepID=UPI001F34663E|nr:hypothetical protein [Marinagarivorans cellulosilyticus]
MNTGLLVINCLATGFFVVALIFYHGLGNNLPEGSRPSAMLFMLKKKVITFSLGASALSLVAMLVIQLSML